MGRGRLLCPIDPFPPWSRLRGCVSSFFFIEVPDSSRVGRPPLRESSHLPSILAFCATSTLGDATGFSQYSRAFNGQQPLLILTMEPIHGMQTPRLDTSPGFFLCLFPPGAFSRRRPSSDPCVPLQHTEPAWGCCPKASVTWMVGRGNVQVADVLPNESCIIHVQHVAM